MRKLIYTLAIALVSLSVYSQATYCLEFQNPSVSADGNTIEFDISISGSEEFLLGSSNLQFSYDNTKVSEPVLISTPLAAPSYQTPTVTEAVPGEEASFNIEAPFTALGFGEDVPVNGFIVGKVGFTIEDPSALTDFSWVYNGGTTETTVVTEDGGSTIQIFATDGGNTCLVPLENVALPIKMKSFTAVPFQNRDANLDWVTASEVNGSHFEVERSDDGVNFTQIGRVEATGNTATDHSYAYVDRDVNMQRNDVVQYYRIKMVDVDGEYKYSGVRVVNFTRSDIDFTINAYPNPTTDFVQLNLTGIDNTSTDRPMLRIFTNTGELVRSQVLDSDLGKIDMSDLPGSLYHFMIDYNGQQYNEKIVVIK